MSASANSGLATVRYSWNTALDAACTAGSATSSGTTLTAPAGDNLLYLCARDNSGRVTQWNGRYRISTPVTARAWKKCAACTSGLPPSPITSTFAFAPPPRST